MHLARFMLQPRVVLPEVPGTLATPAGTLHPGTSLPIWVRDCAGRAYLDADGRWWCVTERPCRDCDPPGTTCLVFMSQAIVRRVLTFPSDWRLQSNDVLEAISWQR